MSIREGYAPGVPSFIATIQPDRHAARSFYSGLLGWEVDQGAFDLARLRGRIVAGLGDMPAGVARPAWMTHVEVVHVDEAVGRAPGLGGAVHAAPFDLPIGRSAVLADPAGVVFSVSALSAAG